LLLLETTAILGSSDMLNIFRSGMDK